VVKFIGYIRWNQIVSVYVSKFFEENVGNAKKK